MLAKCRCSNSTLGFAGSGSGLGSVTSVAGQAGKGHLSTKHSCWCCSTLRPVTELRVEAPGSDGSSEQFEDCHKFGPRMQPAGSSGLLTELGTNGNNITGTRLQDIRGEHAHNGRFFAMCGSTNGIIDLFISHPGMTSATLSAISVPCAAQQVCLKGCSPKMEPGRSSRNSPTPLPSR